MTIPITFRRVATLCMTMATVLPAISQQDASKAPLASAERHALTKFDLDFPGGTPRELVAAIQKSMGRPINVIVPNRLEAIRLPALMMRQVDAAQLFMALSESSLSNELAPNANTPTDTYRSSYQFSTIGNPTDDSVWFLRAPDSPRGENSPKPVQFFQLTPYLDQGFTVDDITTAIQTGWKMANTLVGAELSYHKETKLLIVVGNNMQIQTVSLALHALSQQKPKPAAPSVSGKPTEATKTEK